MSRDFSRQELLVPSLQEAKVAVIGCGAIGRNVALQLGAIGVGHLTLVDFDSVEDSNVTTQGFSRRHIGYLKPEAVGIVVRDSFQGVNTREIHDRYRPSQDIPDLVFCCVDSISARQAIWNGLRGVASFFCDGRMLNEVFRVVTVSGSSPGSDESYEGTLFEETEAEEGRCTRQATIYVASCAAALMVQQFVRHIRWTERPDSAVPCDQDFTFNVGTSTLVHGTTSEEGFAEEEPVAEEATAGEEPPVEESVATEGEEASQEEATTEEEAVPA